ncbi:hypothetical protein KZ483_26825 [Paenibacillus sp. sptzw28]|uniref:hypothetical protein n=1 Tax=Paenibacillus sp. sptzw28 TaxID=715179 RepID=UPI001C6E3712|nr:hypothetical protein [Paenibacillus sp. sptzw28]QYR21253.1 hypothetical protein KZ483_26825 [Paenibacillus sp. sptzw28]
MKATLPGRPGTGREPGAVMLMPGDNHFFIQHNEPKKEGAIWKQHRHRHRSAAQR